jgi:hypothetical protein
MWHRAMPPSPLGSLSPLTAVAKTIISTSCTPTPFQSLALSWGQTDATRCSTRPPHPGITFTTKNTCELGINHIVIYVYCDLALGARQGPFDHTAHLHRELGYTMRSYGHLHCDLGLRVVPYELKVVHGEVVDRLDATLDLQRGVRSWLALQLHLEWLDVVRVPLGG